MMIVSSRLIIIWSLWIAYLCLYFRDDSMVLTTKSSPEDFFSYLSMWTAYRNYSKTNPDKEDLLAVFRRR